MAIGSEPDERDDVVSSDSLTEETTAAKHLSSSIETLTLISPCSEDSIHAMLLPTLPFEIVVEILSRLPVKFLMQFQCVCRSWKSLISDPKFAKKHLRHTRQSLILTLRNPSLDFVVIVSPLSSVFTQVTTIATQLEYPVNKQDHHAFMIGSCHGIFCFRLSMNLAILWNPSIRKFTKLPPWREVSFPYYCFSFGYDDFSDTYKVVVVCNEIISIDGLCDHCKTLVKVHTLGTTSWTRIQDFPPLILNEDESSKFVSGAIHWLMYHDFS